MNSFKYAYSNNKKKAWSPNIQDEERFRKKREREDAYINNFHPMDRPVLVIKEKHKFEGINPTSIPSNNDKEEFYKVT